jgi:drug/metabolite transporter (DMT)-like permease
MSRRPSSELVGAGLIILAAVSFGTLGPLSRYADQAGVSSLTLVTWRAAVGAACVAAFLTWRTLFGHHPISPWRTLPAPDRWFVSVAALTNAGLNLAVFTAFVRIGIALTLLIFYLYPALVAIASVARFGEQLDRIRWAALGVSLAGVILVMAGAGPVDKLDLVGIGLALIGALAQMFDALSARHGFGSIPGPQAAAITMSGAAAAYLAFGLLIGHLGDVAQPLASLTALWPVLLAGVVGAGLPTVCFITGIRRLGAPRATILATLEPVVGVGLAALLFNEPPTGMQIVGGALIISAGILLQLRRPEVAEHEALPEEETAAGPAA